MTVPHRRSKTITAVIGLGLAFYSSPPTFAVDIKPSGITDCSVREVWRSQYTAPEKKMAIDIMWEGADGVFWAVSRSVTDNQTLSIDLLRMSQDSGDILDTKNLALHPNTAMGVSTRHAVSDSISRDEGGRLFVGPILGAFKPPVIVDVSSDGKILQRSEITGIERVDAIAAMDDGRLICGGAGVTRSARGGIAVLDQNLNVLERRDIKMMNDTVPEPWSVGDRVLERICCVVHPDLSEHIYLIGLKTGRNKFGLGPAIISVIRMNKDLEVTGHTAFEGKRPRACARPGGGVQIMYDSGTAQVVSSRTVAFSADLDRLWERRLDVSDLWVYPARLQPLDGDRFMAIGAKIKHLVIHEWTFAGNVHCQTIIPTPYLRVHSFAAFDSNIFLFTDKIKDRDPRVPGGTLVRLDRTDADPAVNRE